MIALDTKAADLEVAADVIAIAMKGVPAAKLAGNVQLADEEQAK